MNVARPNLHGVGFLPGGESLKYDRPPVIQVLKNREDSRIQEWCRRTGSTWKDLQMMNYAFLVDQTPDGVHQVQFIKCRDRDLVIAWCMKSWSAPDGVRWGMLPTQAYNPCMWVLDSSDVAELLLVWS